MKSILRVLAAVAAGMVVAFILVIAVEIFSNAVHPFPPDFKGTEEEMCRHVERIPHWVLAVAVAAWGAITFVGTWIAGRLGNIYSSAIVGLLLLAAVVLNISMLPYPIWFKIADLIAIPIALVAGCRTSMRKKNARTAEPN